MNRAGLQLWLSRFIYGLSIVIGFVAFFYPFFLPQLEQGGSFVAHEQDAPILTVVLLILGLSVLLIEVQGNQVSAKIVAALGVLVAINAILRFVEVAIPAPGGFSPIFALIILAGYVFGGRFGFLMGVMTLVVSALITGTVGPWLPYQMFVAGWVGLTAGWLPQVESRWLTLTLLLLFGFVWGLLYGFMMNLYFWPFVAGASDTSWAAGLSFREGVQRYVAFYLLTSLFWDLARSIGNVVLILALGWPTIRALRRFRDRFQFEYR